MTGPDFPKAILEAVQRDLPAVRAGLPMASPELRALTEQALAFAKSPEALDVPVQAAVAALLAQGAGRGEVVARLVDVWIARMGPAFALRAAVAQRRLVMAYARDARRPGGFDLSVRWLEARRDAQLPVALDQATWDVLRGAAARAKGEEKERVSAAIAELRVDAPLLLATWIDGIAPEPRFVAADLDAWLAQGAAERALVTPWVFPLVAGLMKEPGGEARRLGAALLDAVRDDPAAIRWVAPWARSLCELLGAAAAAPLTALLSAAHASRGAEARTLKKVAEALLPLESEPVARLFGTMLESKVLRPIAAKYMQLHAAQAVGVLGTGRAGAAVLRDLAQSRPDEVREGLAELSAPEQKDERAAAVAKVLRQTAGSREADETELPWVLREPPWRRSQARPPLPTVMGLPSLDFEEQTHLVDTDTDDLAEDDDSPVALLARSGTAAIGPLLERAKTEMNDALFLALRRVESPRVAWTMALARRTSRRAHADAWLGRFTDAAATALLPIALGPSSRDQATATAALLSAVQQGRVKAVRRVAVRFGDDAVRALEAWLAAAPLYAAPERPPRLPAYADVALLPRIALRNGALMPPRAGTLIAEMMYFSEPDVPYAGLEQVKQACDPRSLDAWLSALMHAWEDAGALPAGTWVLHGMARLGGADAVRELSRSIKAWSRSRDTRPRAIAGLEALASGDASARTALADFARKGLRGETAEKAEELLGSLARKLRLTEDDLADVLSPSLDLDRSGTCVLDFGPRRFTVGLDEHLAPRITDEAGTLLHEAPRARKSDDPVKARAANEQLKSLRKGLAELAAGAIFRFELAMVTERRYRREVFDAVCVHPILGRVARRLVWAARDAESGALRATLRITEDGSFADESDRALAIDEGDVLSVLHPLRLDARVVAMWGERFGDYEIVQPFPQLARPIFTPTADERVRGGVLRFEGIEAPFMAICGRLEARGWQRRGAMEGSVPGYHKRFGERLVFYDFSEPIVFGQPMPLQTKIGAVRFREPLEAVGALVFSEAAYDLHVFGDRS